MWNWKAIGHNHPSLITNRQYGEINIHKVRNESRLYKVLVSAARTSLCQQSQTIRNKKTKRRRTAVQRTKTIRRHTHRRKLKWQIYSSRQLRRCIAASPQLSISTILICLMPTTRNGTDHCSLTLNMIIQLMVCGSYSSLRNLPWACGVWWLIGWIS